MQLNMEVEQGLKADAIRIREGQPCSSPTGRTMSACDAGVCPRPRSFPDEVDRKKLQKEIPLPAKRDSST